MPGAARFRREMGEPWNGGWWRLEALGGVSGFNEDGERVAPFFCAELGDEAILRFLPQGQPHGQGLSALVRELKDAAPLAIWEVGFDEGVFL